MAPLLVFVVLLAVIIVFSVWARRRQIRNRLLRHGTRTSGSQVKVSTAPAGSSALRKAIQTVTVITYTDATGTRRSVVPRQFRAFDRGDASGAVVVVYDARKPRIADRVLFGYGTEPTRWYRVRFHAPGAAG